MMRTPVDSTESPRSEGAKVAVDAPHRRPDAVIFDLDGVVTFTARIHEAAWKELFDTYLRDRQSRENADFRAFDSNDYRTYVDGRPRYDGVREFLASRDIELPYGSPSDPPDLETVRGLGNRKNEIFRRRLAVMDVDVDAEAVRLIRELKLAGIPVGMASSSRNAGPILERAGLQNLFDAHVDGVVSERLALEGKPAPDAFLACLEFLGGGDASRAVMVEDAIAGVAAGRAAGFGLVVGVDRAEQWLALREHGADWIVQEFASVSADRLVTQFQARELARPNALGAWRDLESDLSGKRPVIFLDYDGTLTPIVERPDLAVLSDAMRSTLRSLARVWPTFIVSGRGLEDVKSLVGLESLIYAASHGFDVAGPPDSGIRLQIGSEIVPLLEQIFDALRERTADIPGVLIENKRFSIAAHYRLVPEERVVDVEASVDAVLAAHSGLRKTAGKMVFELRPELDWDKGKAVLWLLQQLGMDDSGAMPLFIGDDVTDEDAFRALDPRGIGVVVMDVPRSTAAAYAVQNVEEVRMLLERLSRIKT